MNEQILNPTSLVWVAEFLQRPCELATAILTGSGAVWVTHLVRKRSEGEIKHLLRAGFRTQPPNGRYQC